MSEKKHNVSRRQFLTYTLTGVGGFMAAGVILPMARFAVDPVLKAGAESDMYAVAEVADLTEEPQRFDFSYEQVDAWYQSEVTETAWIYREGDNIVALSPTCTHLGCTVNWMPTKIIRISSSVPAISAVLKKMERILRVHRLRSRFISM